MNKVKHLGLRIDLETYRKFKYVAEFEGRSLNSEILYLIHKAISEYEEEYGSIK